MTSTKNNARPALRALAAQRVIAQAVESNSLSNDLMLKLARRFGLEETQEAAVECMSALEERRETTIPRMESTLDKCMSVLFWEKTANKLGVELPAEDAAETRA